MKIVVIEACGLHLGYLGCYGNDWTGTPNLDRLAAEGVVFDWHFADQPEVQPNTPWAERSIATGCYRFPGATPPPWHVAAKSPAVVRCLSAQTFAEQALPAIEKGDAWLWIEGPSLLPPWRLDDDMLRAYFDEDDVEEGLEPWPDPPLETVRLSEAETLELQNTYAAAVTSFDAQLGFLLDGVRERGILDKVLFCVTARSGLPLGEHGMIGTPRPSLHDELVHIPLVMRLPDAAEAGLRIAALTQPIDLLPTFLEAMDAAGLDQSGMHGRSLWPLLRGVADEMRPYAVSGIGIGAEESRLLRTKAWALHVRPGLPGEAAPALQIFAKPEDRWEVNDLRQQQMELAELMEKTLGHFVEAIRQPGPVIYPPIS